MFNDDVAGCRVLIVEDDYLLATDLTGLLRRAGADIIGPVGSVRDALAAFEQSPDVALLDVQLGEETSFPIADELARRGVPFVFAPGTPAMIPFRHGARTVCAKPLGDAAILKALAEALSPRES